MAFLKIKRVREDSASALQFGNAVAFRRNLIRPCSSRADNVASQAIAAQFVGALSEHGHRFANLPPLFFSVFDSQKMSFVAHDADELDPFEFGNRQREVKRVPSRPSSHAIQADVHLDDDSARHPVPSTDRGQRLDLGKVVARNDRISPGTERGQSLPLRLSDYHVGNQDIANPCRRHHFGFGNLGDRDADGSGSDLFSSDRRSLVALGVRPPTFSMAVKKLSHPLDVAVHQVEINAKNGGVEIGFVVADVTCCHGVDSEKGLR